MDNTALFRACVKAVKVRKNLDAKAGLNERDNIKCPFENQGNQISKSVTSLRNFLLKTRKDYINSSRLFTAATALTDYDRDQIDSQTESAIKSCNHLIKNLKNTIKVQNSPPQLYRHRQAMIEIIEVYLKAVCKLYSEQRAVRVKKATDMKRMSRLSALVHHKKKLLHTEQSSKFTDSTTGSASDVTATASGLRKRTVGPKTEHTESELSTKKPKASKKVFFEEESEIYDEPLTERERIQLCKENDVIYERMNSLVDEIQQLEGKVIEISHLQQVFTEKVLEQEGDIYRINEVAIHTTENVKSGNEQIRQAMKSKSVKRLSLASDAVSRNVTKICIWCVLFVLLLLSVFFLVAVCSTMTLDFLEIPAPQQCHAGPHGRIVCVGVDEYHQQVPVLFPMFCLILGLALDEVNKLIHVGRVRFPSSVFQFIVSAVVAVIAHQMLTTHELSVFEHRYTWVHAHSDFILSVLLPILIFDSAFHMNSHAFYVNIKLILIITIGCYMVSFAFQGATILFTLYTERFSASQAFVFASVVSATDPVAVVSLLEEIGAPYRLRSILEGESLLNDGVAIITFRLCRAWLDSETESGAFNWSTFSLFGTVLASLIIGYIAALMAIWALGHGSIVPGKAEAILFVFVYGIYIICEEVVQGSGVLGLVAMGLTLSDLRQHIKPQICDEISHAWRFLSYWANCIIFILAGYHVGRVFNNERLSVTYDSVIVGFLMYPYGIFIRCFFFAVFYFIMDQLNVRRNLSLTDYVCLAWGGLRGALPLLLSLELFEAGAKIEIKDNFLTDVARLNLALVSGTVVMSLLIQGTTFEILSDRVGLRSRSEYKTKTERRILEYLQTVRVRDEADKLQRDHYYYYGGANWIEVGKIIRSCFNPHLVDSQDTAASFVEPVADSDSHETSIGLSREKEQIGLWQLDDEDEHLEVKRAYLAMLLGRVWEMWRRGALSNGTVRVLVSALEHAIDRAEFTSEDLQFLTEKLRASETVKRISKYMTNISEFSLKFCLYSSKKHKDPVTRDWWIVFSAALTTVYFGLIMHAAYLQQKGSRRLLFFFTLFFFIFFCMEQAVIMPKVTKACKSCIDSLRKKVKVTRDQKSQLISAALDFSWFVATVVLVVIVSILLIPTDVKHSHSRCLIGMDQQIWNQDSGCQKLRTTLTILACYALAVKLVIGIPLLVKLAADMLELYVMQRLRVTLSALLALGQITEEITLVKEVFPEEQEWKAAREMNKKLHTDVEQRLRHELSNDQSYIPLYTVLRTRQASRTMVTALDKCIDELAQDGLITDEEVKMLKKRVAKALLRIERMTKVPNLPIKDALITCNWIAHLDNADKVVDFIWNNLSDQIDIIAGKSFLPENDMWFLYEGICRIKEVRVYPAEAKRKPDDPIEDYKYPSSWINERLLFPIDRIPHKRITAKCVTNCKFYRLPRDKVQELTKFDNKIVVFAVQQDCYRMMRKALRGFREFAKRYTAQQLYDWIGDETRMIRAYDWQRVTIPENYFALMSQGLAKQTNAIKKIHAKDMTPVLFEGPVTIELEPDPNTGVAYLLKLDKIMLDYSSLHPPAEKLSAIHAMLEFGSVIDATFASVLSEKMEKDDQTKPFVETRPKTVYGKRSMTHAVSKINTRFDEDMKRSVLHSQTAPRTDFLPINVIPKLDTGTQTFMETNVTELSDKSKADQSKKKATETEGTEDNNTSSEKTQQTNIL